MVKSTGDFSVLLHHSSPLGSSCGVCGSIGQCWELSWGQHLSRLCIRRKGWSPSSSIAQEDTSPFQKTAPLCSSSESAGNAEQHSVELSGLNTKLPHSAFLKHLAGTWWAGSSIIPCPHSGRHCTSFIAWEHQPDTWICAFYLLWPGGLQHRILKMAKPRTSEGLFSKNMLWLLFPRFPFAFSGMKRKQQN